METDKRVYTRGLDYFYSNDHTCQSCESVLILTARDLFLHKPPSAQRVPSGDEYSTVPLYPEVIRKEKEIVLQGRKVCYECACGHVQEVYDGTDDVPLHILKLLGSYEDWKKRMAIEELDRAGEAAIRRRTTWLQFLAFLCIPRSPARFMAMKRPEQPWR